MAGRIIIGILVALVCGEVSYGEYLAKYTARHPASVYEPRRIFRRDRPYLIPGKTVLRNNFGIDDQAMLDELEFIATAGRLAQWHCRIARDEIQPQDVDFAKAHQHTFADVYSWAGNYRVTELRRGAVLFAWQSEVRVAMHQLVWTARRLVEVGARLDKAALAYRFACMYAEYNRVHPFREGNGRTGTLVLHTVSALCGRRLDLEPVSREEWIAAARDSMPQRRSGDANHRPFLPLFIHALADGR